MARLRLTIAYVGTRYFGWQTQRCPKTMPTIQEELERAASLIAGMPVHIHASGRTDTGVHAERQCAHMDIPDHKLQANWIMALNGITSDDISILDVRHVPDSFHAQKDVQRKIYTYRFWLSHQYVLPQRRPFVWRCGPLDLDKVCAALPALTGTHDFASLKNVGTPVKSSVRTLFALEPQLDPLWPEFSLQISGSGFLKQMVRNIAGLLAAIGQGKVSPDAIPELLAAQDRTKAPPTAPAQGLTLTDVMYEHCAPLSIRGNVL